MQDKSMYSKEELNEMLEEFSNNLSVLDKVYSVKRDIVNAEAEREYEQQKRLLDENLKKVIKKTTVIYGSATVGMLLGLIGARAFWQNPDIFDFGDRTIFAAVAILVNGLRQVLNFFDYDLNIDSLEKIKKEKVLAFEGSDEIKRLKKEIDLNTKWKNAINEEIDSLN